MFVFSYHTTFLSLSSLPVILLSIKALPRAGLPVQYLVIVQVLQSIDHLVKHLQDVLLTHRLELLLQVLSKGAEGGREGERKREEEREERRQRYERAKVGTCKSGGEKNGKDKEEEDEQVCHRKQEGQGTDAATHPPSAYSISIISTPSASKLS